MNGNKRLYLLSIDNLVEENGRLHDSFGEKELWSDEIEQMLSVVETNVNKILKMFDEIEISKQPNHKCTVWPIDEPNKKDVITKMALLQPKLLIDLKDGKNFEKNIKNILNHDYSTSTLSVFYIKLYDEFCNGKFVITDYLGQPIIDFLDIENVNTLDDLKSGNIKYCKESIPYYFVTGEYEFFFIGSDKQLQKFLNSLLAPILYLTDSNGKEFKLEKTKKDFFELTVFNLNQLKAQESCCQMGSYDKEYFDLIKKELPTVIGTKIMLRETSKN